jgi:hypothetical protein
MKYFKNAELARIYNVSEKSVRNWINAADQGKINLELYQHDGKLFVADSIPNEAALLKFTERAKKYRNSQSHKKIQPDQMFYDTYSFEQIVQIASELEAFHEIPQQFRYIGEAGVHWSSYLHKLYTATTGNNLNNAIELLRTQKEYLLQLTSDYDRINLVDIGVGNGLAVKELLSELYKTGKFHTYVGLDISPELLTITNHNVNNWFEGNVAFDGHVIDINNQNFRSILAKHTYDESGQSTINIVTLLGSLLPNFRDVDQALSLIRDSLNPQDLLITTLKEDFHTPSEPKDQLPIHHRRVAEAMGIDPSMYDIEQLYDKELRCRQSRIKLKVAITIDFIMEGYRRSVSFEKGDRIILWRGWHWTAEELIDLYKRQGFSLLLTSKSKDGQLLLQINRISAPTANL